MPTTFLQLITRQSKIIIKARAHGELPDAHASARIFLAARRAPATSVRSHIAWIHTSVENYNSVRHWRKTLKIACPHCCFQVFALTPLCSASIIFGNSLLGKMYMTTWRLSNPEGEKGNPAFDNAHKAQLNEAEWSPFLIGGLMCLQAKDDTTRTVAAALVAYGSIWYLWSRILLRAKNGEPAVLVGGVSRYIGGTMILLKLMLLKTASSGCPAVPRRFSK